MNLRLSMTCVSGESGARAMRELGADNSTMIPGLGYPENFLSPELETELASRLESDGDGAVSSIDAVVAIKGYHH